MTAKLLRELKTLFNQKHPISVDATSLRRGFIACPALETHFFTLAVRNGDNGGSWKAAFAPQFLATRAPANPLSI